MVHRVVLVVLLVSNASVARAERPADPLLRLVPPDAGVTLAVEDLRGQAHTFLDSPVASALSRLPAARQWALSPDFQRLEGARREIEGALHANIATLRDDLLGDALVLAMTMPAGQPPDAARGLLLLRPRDPALLDRAIAAVNESDRPMLRALVSRTWKGTSYQCRRFLAGAKPDEWYALLDNGRFFAWSNSEDFIRGVIDRHHDGASHPNLLGLTTFQRLREGLPARAVASLFLEARTFERLVREDPRARGPDQERIARALLGSLQAVEYTGLALEWRDGPILHVRQEMAVERVPGSWRTWASREGTTAGPLRQVPPSAIALIAGHLHLPPVMDALRVLMPASDWSRLELLAEAVRGTVTDSRTFLASLGPGGVAYIEAPEPKAADWPWVLATELRAKNGEGDPELARNVEGIMRSALALQGLQMGNGQVPARLVEKEVAGGKVTTLSTPDAPAFAVRADRAVLGSSPSAVGRFLEASPNPVPADFERHRTVYFAGTESFAYVDLDRLRGAIGEHREDVERWLATRQVKPKDLDEALQLLSLFRFGFATAQMGPELRWTHHSIGMISP